MTIASAVIALVAPVLGRNTDRTGRTMSALRVLTWAVAAVDAALFLIADEPVFLWAGFIMLDLGTVASEVAGSLCNGVIDRVPTPQNVGRVASPLAPLMFGLCVGLGARLTGAENTQYLGIVGIAVVLAAGLLVLPARVPQIAAGRGRG